MPKNIDPVCAAFLQKVEKTTYAQWTENEIWNFIRTAVSDKKSAEYKHLMSFTDKKLHDEAYLQAHIDNISFGE
ncbi:MAG: hypothetical protein M3Z87_03305 [Lactobacillus sp.]|nr:hypothetical protein [Lactobacillus sp.]